MRIDINGEIVGNGQKFYDEDFCPQDFKDAISDIGDGEQVDIHITSPGGSVIDGNIIVSSIRELQANGHFVVSYVHGIAASMASVIACACDELHMDENAVLMIHLPFSYVEGNANDMKKEAELLDLMTKSLVSVYRSKFNKTDGEIVQMLTNETWILGGESSEYGLKCVIDNATSEPMKFAAKYKKIFNNFKHIPEVLNMTNEEEITNEDNVKGAQRLADEVLEGMARNSETVKEDDASDEDKPTKEEENGGSSTEEHSEEDNEEDNEEQPTEEPKEDEEVLNKDEVLAKFAEYEKQIEELKQANEELQKKLDECDKPNEETVTKDECEKRISGVQSSFQHKINDLTEQFNLKDKELISAKSEISSLTEKLEKSQRELSEMVASLEEKTLALASLNAAVNAPPKEIPTLKDGLASCKTVAERLDFINSKKYK